MAIFESTQKWHLTYTLCTDMISAKVKNFVEPGEYEEFKKKFVDAKDWLTQE